jgi:hypothetical protein
MEGTATVVDGNTAGPTTFDEAFAADASSASESSDQTNGSASPATEQQASSESTPAGDDRSPYIPRQRFDEVNTERNTLKQWKEQYAWAEQINRDQVGQAVELAQRYQRDPIGFLNELAQELQNSPELGPQLRSMAARTLAAARGQQQAPQEPQMVPVQLEDGSVVQMPRDPSAWLAWHQQQWMQQVEQKMAPAMTAAQRFQQQEHQAQAQAWSSSFMDEITQTYGDISAHREAIAAEVRSVLDRLPASDARRDAPEFLEALTLRAVNKVVLPALAQAKQQELQKAKSTQLDELTRKAGASIAPNPGSATPTAPRAITSFDDPSLQW